MEQNSQANYANNACISVTSGSVSVAYQASNCTGYDTTLGSMKATTNSHVGNTTAYSEYKICVTRLGGAASLTFTVSTDNFPTLTPRHSGASHHHFECQHQQYYRLECNALRRQCNLDGSNIE